MSEQREAESATVTVTLTATDSCGVAKDATIRLGHRRTLHGGIDMVDTRRTLRFLAVGAILAVANIAEAGPPLICHPFHTGSAAVLPWGGGPGWNTPDRKYDVQNLTRDTLSLLSSSSPVIVRMENMRRATIYAAEDARVANELMAAVLARALATATAGTPDASALFDAGYLIESYKQAAVLHRYSMLSAKDGDRWSIRSEPAGDGYALVRRAISLSGSNADMEFAASLMKEGAVSAEHRRRAQTGAAKGSLLAANLAR